MTLTDVFITMGFYRSTHLHANILLWMSDDWRISLYYWTSKLIYFKPEPIYLSIFQIIELSDMFVFYSNKITNNLTL